MQNSDLDNIKQQLSRNRQQQYLYLVLFLIGVGASVFMAFQIQRKNAQLEKQKVQLEQQNEEIEKQKSNLEELNTELQKTLTENKKLTKTDWLVNSIFDLASQSKTTINVKALYKMSNEELEAKLAEMEEAAKAYDVARKKNVRKILSGAEASRKEAQRLLLRKYSSDKKFVGDLLEAFQGVNFKSNSEAYYQVLYILDQLDKSLLTDHKESIKDFFQKGAAAQLNGGASTQQRIDRIKKKMS